jgi:alpha-D-ribose 1-methylphosphonate 5-triphosphate synthase subunit PhnG
MCERDPSLPPGYEPSLRQMASKLFDVGNNHPIRAVSVGLLLHRQRLGPSGSEINAAEGPVTSALRCSYQNSTPD